MDSADCPGLLASVDVKCCQHRQDCSDNSWLSKVVVVAGLDMSVVNLFLEWNSEIYFVAVDSLEHQAEGLILSIVHSFGFRPALDLIRLDPTYLPGEGSCKCLRRHTVFWTKFNRPQQKLKHLTVNSETLALCCVISTHNHLA